MDTRDRAMRDPHAEGQHGERSEGGAWRERLGDCRRLQEAAPGKGRDLLSRREVMDYLQIGPTTLWRMTTDGRIPHVRIGRRVLYRSEDLRAFVQRHRRSG